mgnify:CR=1 FL=1
MVTQEMTVRQMPNPLDGRYGLETRESRHEGSYRLRVHWLGLMERDDEDFLLLHKERSLEKWEAEERSSRGEKLALLKTDDFSERPELRVNYVLREEDVLLIDFAVVGFDIPRSGAAYPRSFRPAAPFADVSRWAEMLRQPVKVEAR